MTLIEALDVLKYRQGHSCLIVLTSKVIAVIFKNKHMKIMYIVIGPGLDCNITGFFKAIGGMSVNNFEIQPAI